MEARGMNPADLGDSGDDAAAASHQPAEAAAPGQGSCPRAWCRSVEAQLLGRA